MLIIQLLFLLLVANGTPVLAKRLLGRHFACPLDGGLRFLDGQRLFGPTKTLRGLLLSVLLTCLAAALLGMGWQLGIIIGSTAILGDLFSSFIKRRLKMSPSSMSLGLDQVPESLFPLLAAQDRLALATADIVLIVVMFFFAELLLSRLLFRLKIRDRPY